ncbi:unnamed protein product [Symbiodinium natans]|uniref:Uncharacterized protein n=1 Tax=Symbiodinium natans TaxID=878477 RepID=A0A812S032_9DINO|nr:unnamed protein product [Symbiodinium natans]
MSGEHFSPSQAPEVLSLDNNSSSPEVQIQPQQSQPLQLLLMEDSRQNRAPFGVLAPECLSPCMDADESAGNLSDGLELIGCSMLFLCQHLRVAAPLRPSCLSDVENIDFCH